MPIVTTEQYTRRRRIELGEWVMARKRVYLDKCFWIALRDSHLGVASNPRADALLRGLRLLVKEKRCICPISDVLFMELLKQSDPETRAATAELIDELSHGVTLISHPERVATEVAHFFYANSQHCVHPLESLVWSKVSYVLGIQHPVLPGVPEAQQQTMQQAFFDHMWGIQLAQMIAILDGKNFPESPYTGLAKQLNAGNAAHAGLMKSFKQVYEDEMCGALEVAVPIACEVLEEIAVAKAGYRQKMSQDERDSLSRETYAFLRAAIAKSDVRRALRTLHIGAALHAGARWNRTQKIVANDLYDFHHAEAAVGYCDVFFTDGPMRTLLVQRHLGIERDFPCSILSSWGEAVAWTQGNAAP